MSEIEINEDNCVLTKSELEVIDDIFYTGYKGIFELKEPAKNIFQKINKLNEMAKEKKDGT